MGFISWMKFFRKILSTSHYFLLPFAGVIKFNGHCLLWHITGYSGQLLEPSNQEPKMSVADSFLSLGGKILLNCCAFDVNRGSLPILLTSVSDWDNISCWCISFSFHLWAIESCLPKFLPNLDIVLSFFHSFIHSFMHIWYLIRCTF